MNLRWYAARLRAMSPREFLYRVQQSATLRKRAALAGRTPALRFLRELPELPQITEPRRVRFFDIDLPYDGTSEIDWHRDYSSGIRGPLRFYGSIDYRDDRRVGDIKYTWELNRHQFMVPWASNYAHTHDEQDAAAIAHLLLNWIAANPRYIGINWSSSLELALRLLSWGIVYDLCSDSVALEVIRPMVERSVVEQANYIRDSLSRYSSANNHLMGELVGLLAAGILFPEAPGTRQHAEFARTEIVNEALRQNFGDGVNREQAIYYHHYTLEYLTTAIALFKRAGWTFPQDALQIVRSMVGFVQAMADDNGTVPEIGDRDDGSVTGLNLGAGAGIYESLLWTGWRVFDEEAFAQRAAAIARSRGEVPRVDRRTEYWHGDSDAAAYANAPSEVFKPRQGAQIFQQGGYAIFKTPTPSGALQVVFKAGPFGYPRIAAHAHCDQLSICARLGDVELFTDSGTYCYHGHEKWRRYFKGTAAHNTVRVDGKDQAEYAGAFLWGSHADGQLRELETTDTGFRIVGLHSGYRRLPQPVEHTRTIDLASDGKSTRVRDVLASSSAHAYELIWNLGPGINPERQHDSNSEKQDSGAQTTATWALIHQRGSLGRLTIHSVHPFEIQVFQGDEHEPAGWYSRKFGDRVPIYQLRVMVNAGWWSVDSTLEIL